MKNAIATNDVATKVDLIKSKETKIKKALISMSVTADDKVNLNRLRKNETIDDIWKTWTYKINKIDKSVCTMFTDRNFLIKL